MVYDPRTSRPGQNPLYRCRERKCVTRTAAVAEEVVENLVIARLSRPSDALTTGDAPPDADVQAALDEAATLRTRLVALELDVAEGRMSGEAFGRIEAKISESIAEAEARAQRAVVVEMPAVVRKLIGKDVAARWKRLPIEDRRAIVRALFVEPVFLRKRGTGIPADALGLAFRWEPGGKLQVV
jgi:hypothetical protein